MSKSITDRHNTIGVFSKALRDHSTSLQFKQLKISTFNIYGIKQHDLVAVLLHGSNKSEDHCVTTLGQWIFDSNLEKAIQLKEKTWISAVHQIM